MSTIGSIEIQMLADLARLRQDMNEAKSVVGNAMNGIKSVVSGAMGGLMAGLSVAAFGAWIKGAVAAADETSKMAQKIGVATQDLAGIQLAFKQAGVEGNAMQQAMVKLAQNVANGDDVFKRMGVTVTDSKQALYAIADVFAGMPDGINKTALATEIFGRAGADLVPLLNAGSAGMKEMADMAEKLGLVINNETATAAEEFNDTVELIGLSTQGMARQVMAQLMPTLKGLANTFLENVTSGDKLAKGADIIAAALKGLFSVGAIGAEVFNTLGKTIGAVAAAVVSAAQGEFRQAWKILEEGGRDIGQGWGATAKTLQSVWSDAGSATVDQALKMTAALNGTTVATKAQAKAAEDAAKAAKAAAAEAKKIAAKELKLVTDIAKARSDARQAEAKSIADWELSEDQRRNKEVQSAQEAVAAAQLEYDTQGMLRSEIAALTLQRLQDKQVAYTVGSANYEAVQMEIDAQRELIAVLQKGEVRDANVEAAKNAAEEWQRASDQIGQSLADALMQGGKSAAEYITGLFRTMVLRPVIEAVTKPVGNAALGMLGMGGSGSAFASGGSSLSMLGGLGGAFSSFGTGMAYGGASGLAGGLTGASAMIGSGNVAMGMGAGFGAVAPYLAAAYAVYAIAKSMDDSGTPHVGSVVSGSGLNLSTLMGDDSGITNNYNASTDAALRGIVGSSTGILNALGGGYSATAKFAADNTDASIGQYILGRNGSIAGTVGTATSLTGGGDYAKYTSDATAGLEAFTADIVRLTREQLDTLDLPGWARDQLDNLGSDADLTQLAGVANAIEATITALDNLRDAFGPLGGVFENIAGLSSDALYALAESSGGLDALGSSMGTFFQNFYDEGERVEMQTAAMTAALGDVGLALPESRDAFRGLVEGLDLTSESGREQFGVLMEVAGAFAELNPIIEETTSASKEAEDALRQAAAAMKEREGLEVQLLQLQGDTIALRERERNALDESNRALYDQITALQDSQAAAEMAAAAAAEAAAGAAAIASERAGLERQLLKLQGDTVAIRELERNALDESNRALYDQINALNDQAVAADKAAAAARRLADAEAKANAPVTSAQIKSAAALLLEQKAYGTDDEIIARITGGAYGKNYASEYERMTGYGPQGASGAFTAMQRAAYITGAKIADEISAQTRSGRLANQSAQASRIAAASSGLPASTGPRETDLLKDQIDGTQDLIDALDKMRIGLLDLKNELIGGELDPSNPALKYASEKDFVTGLGRQALTGDMAAAAMFQDELGGFLQLSQSYNASSAAYANDFSTMISLLDQIAASMERQQSTAAATLKVQQSGLSQVADSTERTAQATTTQARSARVLEQRAIE